MTNEDFEERAADVAVGPRVSREDVESSIAVEGFISGYDVIKASTSPEAVESLSEDVVNGLKGFTICVAGLENGWVSAATSGVAYSPNFDEQLGRDIAHKNVVGNIWQQLGFLLRDRLHRGEAA